MGLGLDELDHQEELQHFEATHQYVGQHPTLPNTNQQVTCAGSNSLPGLEQGCNSGLIILGDNLIGRDGQVSGRAFHISLKHWALLGARAGKPFVWTVTISLNFQSPHASLTF